MKRRDVNQIAFATLQQAIGAIPKERDERRAVAAELGRRGGLKGGKARAKTLTPHQRSEIAKKAVAARWKAKKQQGIVKLRSG
jgi:hypothetical protein